MNGLNKITVPATLEHLDTIQDFVAAELEKTDCPMKIEFQIQLAVEEIYVNIAHYAYHPKVGEATVSCWVGGEPLQVTIQFLDGGKPFNPLAKEDTDVTLSAEDREIGGLGILMVKKNMDQVDYAYEDGKNILTIKKRLNAG